MPENQLDPHTDRGAQSPPSRSIVGVHHRLTPMSDSRLSALGDSTRLCALTAAPASLAMADTWERATEKPTELPCRYSL